jgi:hypothetical protein
MSETSCCEIPTPAVARTVRQGCAYFQAAARVGESEVPMFLTRYVVPTAASLALLTGLVVASLQPSSQPGPGARPEVPPAIAPTPRTGPDEALVARERGLWDAVKGRDVAALKATLSDDLVFVTPEGLHDRNWTLAGIQKDKLVAVELSDWRTRRLSADIDAVIYKAVQDWNDGEGKPHRVVSYCQTTWVRQGDTQIAQIHQETWLLPGRP